MLAEVAAAVGRCCQLVQAAAAAEGAEALRLFASGARALAGGLSEQRWAGVLQARKGAGRGRGAFCEWRSSPGCALKGVRYDVRRPRGVRGQGIHASCTCSGSARAPACKPCLWEPAAARPSGAAPERGPAGAAAPPAPRAPLAPARPLRGAAGPQPAGALRCAELCCAPCAAQLCLPRCCTASMHSDTMPAAMPTRRAHSHSSMCFSPCACSGNAAVGTQGGFWEHALGG